MQVGLLLARQEDERKNACQMCGTIPQGIYTLDPDKCTRDKHVCGSDDTIGCTSCGRLCHSTNADERCPFFNKRRGELGWATTAQDQLDTQAGTRGSVPHRTQFRWRQTNSKIVEIEDPDALGTWIPYKMPYGNPGQGDEVNSCLIDSLHQCVDLAVDRRLVRQDLLDEFKDAAYPAKVTQTSFLDVESHWKAILRSLFRHNTSGKPTRCNVEDYCVITLAEHAPGCGAVCGNLRAPHRFLVMSQHNVHFNPCLPHRSASTGARSSSG